MTKHLSRLMGLSVALGLSLCVADVSAQLLDEVVVTAQKREQDAQDLNISVSAFTGDQLNALGITGAKELADYTPGVQINMEYGNAPTFTVRGVNVNDFGVGTTPAVAVYVDEIFKASNINSGVQLFDLERVEILKGPQGTLWGKNSTGGAVSVITRKPTQETEGYFQVGVGNFNRVEVEGALSGALTDTLSARLSVQSITSDGMFDNVTFPGQPVPGTEPINTNTDLRSQFFGIADEDPGNVDTMAMRTQLLWELDGVDILAIGHYARDRGENHPTTSLFDAASGNGDPDVFDEDVSNEFVYTKDNVFYGASVHLNIDVGDNAEVVSITGYDYFDRNGGLDTNGGLGVAPANSAFTQFYLVEFTQFTQELRYEVTNEDLFWVVGGFYSDSELNQNDEDHYSIGHFFAPFNYRYEHENRSAAVFAQAEYDFNEAFKLTAGVRYTDESRDQPFYRLWFGDNTGPDLPGGSFANPVDFNNGFVSADNSLPDAPPQSFDTDGFSFRLGLDWRPTDTALLYYTFSKGLKSGGYRSDAFTSGGELASFGDEELFAHEVGVKWDPSDRLRVNASAFVYDYQDKQEKVPTVIPPFGELNTMTNMDSVDVSGLEAETIFRAADGFEVGLNLSILDTEISDDSAFDGNELPYAPDFAASAFGRFEGQVTSNLRGSVQLTVNHTGDHFTNVNGANALFGSQDYTLVGVNAAIWDDARGWQLSFYGKNLTDEIYWTNTFSDVGGFISEPASWGFRLRYDF